MRSINLIFREGHYVTFIQPDIRQRPERLIFILYSRTQLYSMVLN